MKRKNYFVLFLLLIIISARLWPFAGASEEYAIKAAMLAKLSDQIEWPESAEMKDKTKTFNIAVIGKNPFSPPLEEFYAEKEIKKKKVKVYYLSSVDEISSRKYHLLFIVKTNKKTLNDILNAAKGKPILTVSDNKGYADRGVHINLVILDNKMRFEINQQSVRESGFVISYHLLRLAVKLVK